MEVLPNGKNKDYLKN